jgi:hypothetical protein
MGDRVHQKTQLSMQDCLFIPSAPQYNSRTCETKEK